MITRSDIEMLAAYVVLGLLAFLGYKGWLRGRREYLPWIRYRAIQAKCRVRFILLPWLRFRMERFRVHMKPFIVRSCLTFDFLLAIPIFVLMIWYSPKLYAEILSDSGETIRGKVLEYYAK